MKKKQRIKHKEMANIPGIGWKQYRFNLFAISYVTPFTIILN